MHLYPELLQLKNLFRMIIKTAMVEAEINIFESCGILNSMLILAIKGTSQEHSIRNLIVLGFDSLNYLPV